MCGGEIVDEKWKFSLEGALHGTSSGADREIQVIKFFEQLGTSRRGIPWVTDGDSRREVPKPTISRYQTRCAQVGCCARARARARSREPPESEFRELTA